MSGSCEQAEMPLRRMGAHARHVKVKAACAPPHPEVDQARGAGRP